METRPVLRPGRWLLLLLLGALAGVATAQEGPRGVLREKIRQRLTEEQGSGAQPEALRPAAKEDLRRKTETATLGGVPVSIWRPVAAAGRVPLVIFSHGFHGMSTQSTFLTTALAEHGYLVVAPDHQDAMSHGLGIKWQPEVSFAQPSQWSDATYRDRGDDIRNVLKALHAEKPWAEMIDWSRVGLAGHSLGGYTALGLAGGWPSWKLPEVKAVLAVSPYCTPYLEQKSLATLGVPVMYQGGTRDFGITPAVKRSGGAYEVTHAPAYFVEFEAAGHFAWTDLITQHQANINHYALAFFDKHLKQTSGADLNEKRPGVADLRAK